MKINKDNNAYMRQKEMTLEKMNGHTALTAYLTRVVQQTSMTFLMDHLNDVY